ncbi:glucose-6-phosphate isomerase [bacterium]|nr:glucose-6-phosphate isomerase [candidate division CSSED10-310 bacterium]
MNTGNYRHENSDTMKLDISNVLSDQIGDRHGITPDEYYKLSKIARSIHENVYRQKTNGELGFTKLPYDTDMLETIQFHANRQKRKWQSIVLFGIGGSALGANMLFKALCHSFHNELTAGIKETPNLYILDNIDPETLVALREIIDPSETLLILVTKSGGTIETWANYFAYLKLFNPSLRTEQVIAITDPKKGFLRMLAEQNAWQCLDIPSDVGGRFSVLSPVGLFPAALLGLDIVSIIEGAKDMDHHSDSCEWKDNPALQMATVTCYLLTQKSKSISVLLPYSNAMLCFADWYRQLWAESLGKRFSVSGKEIFTGQTPIKALGTTDQHSQIQLYVEGPNDKLITFIKINSFRKDAGFHSEVGNTPFKHIEVLRLSELMNIELDGTRKALTENHRPNILIEIPEISEYTIGKLVYFYEMATCYAGKYLDIDAFDQPGVESGKKLAKSRIEEIYKIRRAL